MTCGAKAYVICRRNVEHTFSCWLCDEELCTEGLIPVSDGVLIDAFDRVLVKCIPCGKMYLKRDSFYHRETNKCPKIDVRCPISDNMCPWIGSRDQLEEHLKT